MSRVNDVTGEQGIYAITKQHQEIARFKHEGKNLTNWNWKRVKRKQSDRQGAVR